MKNPSIGVPSLEQSGVITLGCPPMALTVVPLQVSVVAEADEANSAPPASTAIIVAPAERSPRLRRCLFAIANLRVRKATPSLAGYRPVPKQQSVLARTSQGCAARPERAVRAGHRP